PGERSFEEGPQAEPVQRLLMQLPLLQSLKVLQTPPSSTVPTSSFADVSPIRRLQAAMKSEARSRVTARGCIGGLLARAREPGWGPAASQASCRLCAAGLHLATR